MSDDQSYVRVVPLGEEHGEVSIWCPNGCDAFIEVAGSMGEFVTGISGVRCAECGGSFTIRYEAETGDT